MRARSFSGRGFRRLGQETAWWESWNLGGNTEGRRAGYLSTDSQPSGCRWLPGTEEGCQAGSLGRSGGPCTGGLQGGLQWAGSPSFCSSLIMGTTSSVLGVPCPLSLRAGPCACCLCLVSMAIPHPRPSPGPCHPHTPVWFPSILWQILEGASTLPYLSPRQDNLAAWSRSC